MCFSLQWIEQLLIWAVIIVAVYSLIMLVVRFIVPKVQGVLGDGVNIVIQAIQIIFWAFVAIIVIYFIFMLISCLLGMGGGLALPHR